MKKIFLPLLTFVIVTSIFLASYIKKQSRQSKFKEIQEKALKFDYETIELKKVEFLDNIDASILNKGKQEAYSHKIVIAGITRDNIVDLMTMVKHIEFIGGLFTDYKVILFENDSTDGTKEALQKWASLNDKVKIISKDYNLHKRPSHKFMADARNHYLEELKKKEYSNFDLLMIIDMDMSYGIDERGIYSSLAQIDKWDAVCANGISNKEGKLLDAFAFRNAEFPFSPKKWHKICLTNDKFNSWTQKCNEGNNFSKGFFIDFISFRVGFQQYSRFYWLKIMPQIQKNYSYSSPLVEVNSCFGGLALYKIKSINNCLYDSIDNDCEHVSFHDCLKKQYKARIFMNPAMIIKYSHYK